jgi:hypothetical protein
MRAAIANEPRTVAADRGSRPVSIEPTDGAYAAIGSRLPIKPLTRVEAV